MFDAASKQGRDEVNVDPPNPGSLRFHDRLGFTEVGRQATKGDTVTVALLAAPFVAPVGTWPKGSREGYLCLGVIYP